MSLGITCNSSDFFDLKMSVITFKYLIQVLFGESNYICHDLHELAKIFKGRSRNMNPYLDISVNNIILKSSFH